MQPRSYLYPPYPPPPCRRHRITVRPGAAGPPETLTDQPRRQPRREEQPPPARHPLGPQTDDEAADHRPQSRSQLEHHFPALSRLVSPRCQCVDRHQRSDDGEQPKAQLV